MTARRLEGKVAIVTGGSSGIGQGACLALAAEGAKVVVVGRTTAHVEETLRKIDALPGSTPDARMGLTLDVTRELDMAEMARRTVERFGRINVLVASAGISFGTAETRGSRTSVAQIPIATWDEIMSVNLKGMFLSDRAVLRVMMEQGEGDIVNVSSSLGTTNGWAHASAYCASKFGVMGLSQALAEEARMQGVRVQVMVPDAVDTPMLRQSHLAVFGALTIAQTGDLIVEMVTRPRDMLLVNPMIEPFGTWEKPGRGTGFSV